MILDDKRLAEYVDRFYAFDEQTVLSSIPNQLAGGWLASQIPRLDCPDQDIEEIYYFRWWTFRKHLKHTPQGWVVTEFLPDVPWAGRYNTIACAAGHHLYEGRWLQDTGPLLDYARFWYRGGGALHDYSNWIPNALYQLCLTTGDFGPAIDLLPELVADARWWEDEHSHVSGLFWSLDDRDGGEFSISGPGLRTTLNCYLYANMTAIAAIAAEAGRPELQEQFMQKADRLKRMIKERLWDHETGFFRCIPLPDRQSTVANWSFNQMIPALTVRELWGYLPWYFNDAGSIDSLVSSQDSGLAWRCLFDRAGFHGEYGPTTAERCHPLFGIFTSGSELQTWIDERPEEFRQKVSEAGHECLWNGPSWPFATSQTLTALANYLASNLTSASQATVSPAEYLQLLRRYARSQHRWREDGILVPWIDENLDPDNGSWISRNRLKTWSNGSWDPDKGGYERGKDYNHSTYGDLIISGLFGIRPTTQGIEIRPLLPHSDWPYACLDGVPCRGRHLTVLYDRDGTRYNRGQGYQILVDGETIFTTEVPTACRLDVSCDHASLVGSPA